MNFEGQIVLITGAARGLGYAYAVEFAKRGAKAIIINDYATSVSGGQSRGEKHPADVAVETINKLVNTTVAYADYSDVTNDEQIKNLIQRIEQQFKGLHIFIQNAGFLRDKLFVNMTQEDWDKIYQVHLYSTFKLVKLILPLMQKQKYGKIIFTSSAAGLYGNVGQTNYSACKLALFGMAQSLHLENHAKFNLSVNCIAPLAYTRISESAFKMMTKAASNINSDFLAEKLKPENVVPFVLYLCHEKCKESGSIFEMGNQWVSKLRWQRSQGIYLQDFSLEKVSEKWNQAVDFSKGATNPTSTQESLKGMLFASELKQTDATTETSNTNSSAATAEEQQVDGIFDAMQQFLKTNSENEQVMSIQFEFPQGKKYIVSMEQKQIFKQEQEGIRPRLVISFPKWSTFIDVMQGKLQTTDAYMKNLLSIKKGNPMDALKFFKYRQTIMDLLSSQATKQHSKL